MGGYGKMSAEMCDTCQNVLRAHFKYTEARKCIVEALNKPSLRPHTRGLLRVGLAAIYRREGSKCKHRNKVRREIQVAEKAAREAKKTEPRQAARIFWHCAKLADSISRRGCHAYGDKLRQEAQRLAEDTGAKDQLLKIKI